MNLQRIAGPIGILRILTLILGIGCIILTVIYHYPDLKEQFFFSVVAILFFLSLSLLICLITGCLAPVTANSVDMSYHLIGGLTLLLATGIMSYSVWIIGDLCYWDWNIGKPCRSGWQPFIPRIVICGAGGINAIIYCLTGILIRKTEYF